MSAREVAVKRYVVRLSQDERKQLDEMIRKGKSSAQKLMKARILLKADVSEGGEGWSDSRIVEALETSATTVYRTRQQLVEDGFEAVLSRKQPAKPSGRANVEIWNFKMKKPASFLTGRFAAVPATRVAGRIKCSFSTPLGPSLPAAWRRALEALAQSHHTPLYRHLSGRHDCPRRSFPRPSESPIPFKSLEAGR